MSRLQPAFLAASLLVAATPLADAQAPTFDPAQLPAVRGEVAQYTLTPRGDVDGLILKDGLEVQVSPRVTTELVFAVRPGDRVTVHGLKARAEPMMLAASVTNDTTHVTVLTEGRRRSRGRDRDDTIEIQGRIKAPLYDSDGEMDGVLLEDGTVVQVPPPEAQRQGVQLTVGQPIYASGAGVSSVLGRVVAAHLLGPSKSAAKAVAGPEDDDDHGKGGGHRGRHRGDRDEDTAAPDHS